MPIEQEAPSADVAALRERVGRGIEWLASHDEAGVFHFWFEAGISPVSRMPAQDEAKRTAYAEYHRQRGRWEQLSKTLEKVDPAWRETRTEQRARDVAESRGNT